MWSLHLSVTMEDRRSNSFVTGVVGHYRQGGNVPFGLFSPQDRPIQREDARLPRRCRGDQTMVEALDGGGDRKGVEIGQGQEVSENVKEKM